MCASALISINWVIYIYAVNNGHVVDAALGYFINPLVSVALGVVMFGERLGRAQLAALVIARGRGRTAGGGRRRAAADHRVGLALSFGCYGAVKKVVPVGSAGQRRHRSGVAAAVRAGAISWC